MSLHDHNEDWQKALLNHPGIKHHGVDPLWRLFALAGWFFVLLLTVLVTRGSVVDETFLDAMEQVESGTDAGAVGDNGRARGSFQFWAVAWSQVNTLRKAQGLANLDYYHSTNRVIARSFAATYLRWLESTLAATLRRSPNRTELYAAWNLGPTGFRARGFSLARCPWTTRRAARRVENLVRLNAPAGRINGIHSPAPMLAGAF